MNKIVIIEDNDDAWLLLRNLLIHIGYEERQLYHCRSIAELSAIDPENVALVLTDLDLPDSRSTETFEKVCKRFPFAPIIVITDNAEIETGINIIKQGAQDYLVRGEINKTALYKSIQYAIERKRNDNDYKRLFQKSPVAMYIFDGSGSYDILAVNDAATCQYGYSREEFLKLSAVDMRPQAYVDNFYHHVRNHRDTYYDAGKWLHKKKDGTEFYVHVHAHHIDFDGKPARMVAAIDIDQKVRTEQELKRKMKKIEYVMESMTDAFFTVNSEDVYTYVNKAFETIMQRSREDIVGQNIWNAFPDAVGSRFYEGYYKAVQERVNVFFEEYLTIRGRWLTVKIYPMNDGLAVYFMDITEQKQNQKRIQNEEQKLRAIINNTNDVIWSVDRDYNIISANDAFWHRVAVMTGKGKDEIIPTDFDKRLFDQWTRFFDRAFTGETYRIVWEEMVNYELIYSEVSFNPIWNKDGEVIGASCFSRDITIEKKMQEKIIANDINLKGMIDNTEDLIWSVDADMKLIAANQSYLKLIRNMIGRDHAVGENIMESGRYDEAILNVWRKQYARALKGERFKIEREASHPNGVRYTETRFNPIFNLNREVIGVSCFARDITDLKKYLQRIEHQNEQLREIAWLQSHKVRSHVATILGLSELLNTDDPLDENNRKVIEGLKQSSAKLDAVIAEINERTSLIED